MSMVNEDLRLRKILYANILNTAEGAREPLAYHQVVLSFRVLSRFRFFFPGCYATYCGAGKDERLAGQTQCRKEHDKQEAGTNVVV